MNQNLSWPGVPNRYRARSDRNVIRPKSIATVVVVFRPTPLMSSTPTLRSLSVSSVRSGRISLIAPTRVVFPTPNPPAMRILDVAGTTSAAVPRSECLKSIQHLPQQTLIGDRPARRGENADNPVLAQVAEQDPDHPNRPVDVRPPGHNR